MDYNHPERPATVEATAWFSKLEELGLLPSEWKEQRESAHATHEQIGEDSSIVAIDFGSNSSFRDVTISYSQSETSFVVNFSYELAEADEAGIQDIFSRLRADKFRKWLLDMLGLELDLAGDSIAGGSVYNATSPDGRSYLAALLQQPFEEGDHVCLAISLSHNPDPVDLRSEKFAESKFDEVRARLDSVVDAAAFLAKYLSSFSRGSAQRPFTLENGIWVFLIEGVDSVLRIKTPAEYPTQKVWLEMKYAVRALPDQSVLTAEDRKILFLNVLRKYNLPTDQLQIKGDKEVIELAPGINLVHEASIVGGQINCTLTLSLLALNSAERILKKTQLAG
jgi:hypothetical protein